MRALLLLLAACGALWASGSRTEDPVLRIPIWLEPVPAPEDSLKADEFQAQVEGQAAQVNRVGGPEDELMLLVVLDVTGDLSLVGPAKETLVDQIKKLPPNVYVGLLRAQDGLRVLVDPTAERQQLAGAINGVVVSGNAGLLNTIETAAQLADKVMEQSGVPVAVLYVTDSNIYNYREDYTNPVINRSDQRDVSRHFPEGLVKEKISKVQLKLAEYRVPVFVVHLDYRTERLNEAYQSGLLQVADESGGSAVFCRSRAEIPEAIRTAIRRASSLRLLEVQSAAANGSAVQVQLSCPRGVAHYRSRVQPRRR
jgi:hypothetical protein